MMRVVFGAVCLMLLSGSHSSPVQFQCDTLLPTRPDAEAQDEHSYPVFTHVSKNSYTPSEEIEGRSSHSARRGSKSSYTWEGNHLQRLFWVTCAFVGKVESSFCETVLGLLHIKVWRLSSARACVPWSGQAVTIQLRNRGHRVNVEWDLASL